MRQSAALDKAAWLLDRGDPTATRQCALAKR
jgi:hypothetical protein